MTTIDETIALLEKLKAVAGGSAQVRFWDSPYDKISICDHVLRVDPSRMVDPDTNTVGIEIYNDRP